MKKTGLLIAIMLLFQSADLSAQINDTPVNFIEPGYQMSVIFDEPMHFLEIETGKNRVSGWSYGAVLQFGVSDVKRESNDVRETINRLWYTGIRLNYSRMLTIRHGYYAGLTTGLGGVNLRVVEGLENGISNMSNDGGMMIVFRPEVGFRVQFSYRTRMHIGTNMLYAPLLSGGRALTGIPAFRIGFRFGE